VDSCPTKALAYLDLAQMRKKAEKRSRDIVETLFGETGSSDSPTFVKLGYSSRRGGQ